MDQSKLIKIVGILAAASSLVFSLFVVVTAEQVMIEQATSKLHQTSVILANYTYHVLDGANLALRLVEADVRDFAAASPFDEKAAHEALARRMKNFEQSMALLYIDAGGTVRAHSRMFPTKAVDVRDRDYYREQAERCPASERLYIGEQVTNRITGARMVPVSHCLHLGDAKFAGVLMAALDVAYFTDLFSRFNADSGSRIVVRRADGRVLVRWPDDANEHANLRHPLENRVSVTVEVKAFDVFIDASASVDEVRRPWQPIILAVVAGSFLSGLCMLSVVVYATTLFRKYEHWEHLRRRADWKPTIVPGGKQ